MSREACAWSGMDGVRCGLERRYHMKATISHAFVEPLAEACTARARNFAGTYLVCKHYNERVVEPSQPAPVETDDAEALEIAGKHSPAGLSGFSYETAVGALQDCAIEAYAAGRDARRKEDEAIAREVADEAEAENEAAKPDDPMAGVGRDELRSLHRYMAADEIADAIARGGK